MPTEIEWSTDQTGMVLGSRAHDGHIVELTVSEIGPTKIVIKREDGSLVSFVLEGVTKFGLRPYAHNHVVDRVYAWPLASVPTDDLTVWATLFAEGLKGEDLPKAAERLRQKKPADILVRVEFSYTSDMAFQCERLRIFAERG